MKTLTMRRQWFSAIFLLAATIGCSSPSDPSGNGWRDELGRHRRQFQTAVGTSYQVTYQNDCFCPVEVMQPVRLTVRSGAVVEVIRVSDGTAVPPAMWSAYHPVDRVFDEIVAGFENGARRVRVDYDARYGYPADVLIDYQMAADAFVGFHLSDLAPLR